MRFGVGITLFHPTREALEYLHDLEKIFYKIYIYDNSPHNESYKELIQHYSNYIYQGKNSGLAVAYNKFLTLSIQDGLDWLLLLDQDSFYKMDTLKRLMQEIEDYGIQDDTIIRALNSIPAHMWDKCQTGNGVREIDTVISSGSFLNIKVIKSNSLRYDENLFVDHVDDDFCKNARLCGLKILCHLSCICPQQLGYMYKGKICHSAVRHYYMVRDVGYFNQKYHGRMVTVLKSLKYYFKDVYASLYEDRSWKKIRYATRGCLDFFRSRHGEYIDTSQ